MASGRSRAAWRTPGRWLPALLFALAVGGSLALGPLAAVPARALPVILIVNTTSDLAFPPDFGCSLRAAILAANGANAGYCGSGTPDQDSIRFSLGSGTPVINIASDLPTITQGVTINGATGGATRVGLHGPGSGTGLHVSGAGSVIRNLVIDNFDIGVYAAATGVTIAGNHIGPNTDFGIEAFGGNATIGGTNSAAPSGCSGDCNVISGNGSLGLYLAAGGSVTGNRIGTNAKGTTAKPNFHGVTVSSGTWTIGGPGAGQGNLISGNTGHGIDLHGCSCMIQGNLIGTNATGSAALPNGAGIVMENTAGTIGGTSAGEGNIISGNLGAGITVGATSYPSPLSIVGNRIGTKATGGALGNGGDGILVQASNPPTEIGTAASAAAANVIANNYGAGVYVLGNHVAIRRNSIYDNAGAGISLAVGANASIVAPVISSVSPVSGTVCANCTVNIYSDSATEGRTYEGSATADGAGHWSFSGSPGGPNVTATATQTLAQGDVTSEFSAAVAASKPKRPDGRIAKGSGSFVGNNIYNTTGANQTRTASGGAGSTITFKISIQNDGSKDTFSVLGAGSGATGYTITYFHGTHDITSAVVAGIYHTPLLGKGGKFVIKAKVKITKQAAGASSVTRLVTITSLGDGTKQDAVKFVVSRN